MGVTFRVGDFRAPLKIWRLQRVFRRTPHLSVDELRAWQDRQLARIVAQAMRWVPYWREVFAERGLTAADVRTVDDLTKLPVLTRDDVRRAGRRLWSTRPRRHVNTVTTGGTSGVPLTLLMDRNANALEFVYYWRYWGWAGYRLGARFAMFDPYRFMRDSRLTPRAWYWERLTRRLVLNPVALTRERVRDVADAINRFRVRFLKGHASDLYLLACLVREADVPAPRFQALFPTAETLLPQCRRMIEETFGGLVLDSYGHMERVVAVCQCEHGTYHVNADYGVLQLEDTTLRGPDGQPLKRVIGSSLHNRAMPLFRYEVGDLIEALAEPATCPCGRTLPAIKAIHGRQEDVVVTPEGRVVTSLPYLWQHVPEAEFGQVEQDAPDHVIAWVVPGPVYGAGVQARLEGLLAHFLGPTVRFEVRRIDRDGIRTTANRKRRLVISGIRLPDIGGQDREVQKNGD